MRLLFFLTALFLALGLHAQPNCQISDLVTTFSVTDPGSCKYNIKLDFKHQSTTNQFNVKGNGVDYGNFTYTSLPVTLGPIMGQPNAPTVRELIVSDLVNDCKAETTVTLPPCVVVSACEILNATATPGDCVPGGIGFSLKLDFKVQSPGNDFFEVWSGTGVYLGIFPLAALPITLPNFPSNGTVNGSVKICINDRPDCCKTIDFKAPVCPPNCGWIVQPDTGKCTSDSTYSMMFKIFSPNPVPPTDSFLVYANGDYIGTYAWNQLPVTVPNFPWGGGAFDVIQVCAKATLGTPTCCAEAEFLVPKCLPYEPCAMSRIHLEVGDCTSDSTFKVTVNFLVADPTKVDSFSVFADGKFLGKFGLNQLPLMIPNYPWTKGTIFSKIRICTGPAPECCRERQFVVPKCLPFGDCKVTDIQIKTGPCRADGTFKATINFQATNPGIGTFTVFGNGQVLGIFPLSAAPVMVNFPSNGVAVDVVRICINQLTPNTILCCESKQFEGPVCNSLLCDIKNLKVDVGDCNTDGTYKAVIKFDVMNPPSQKFVLFANGQNLGTFDLSQLPLSINLPSNGAAIDVVRVCMAANTPIQLPCCEDIQFEGPDCNNPNCEISNLKVEVGACTSDSTYKATIKFDVQNPPSTKFTVTVNGKNLGTFDLSQLPLMFNNFPSNGTPIDVLKVCMVAQGAVICCKTIEFQGPVCNNQGCEIFNLKVEVGACTNDSTYHATIKFDVQNPPSTKFTVTVNGKNLGTFDLSQLPLMFNNFPSNGAAIDVLKVCMVSQGIVTCCKTIEFQGPTCSNQNCEIFNLKVNVGDCTSDSTYKATINFEVQNPPSSQFVLFVNGQNMGTFNLGQLPLTLNNFPTNGGAIDVVKVCMVSPNSLGCCKAIEFEGPNCYQNCEIFNLKVTLGDCTSDSTYKATVNFEVFNPLSDKFTLFVNGKNLGIFNLNQLPLTLNNFPSNGTATDVLKVCMAAANPGQAPCCRVIEFHGPACGTQNCEIFNLKVTVGDCTSDSTYKATVKFEVQNPPSSQFVLFVNGHNLGTFNLNQLPLTLNNFPSSGAAIDVVKVCMVVPGAVACCRSIEFHGPDCGNLDCKIYDLTAHVGDCTSDSTYKITINFLVQNPGNNFFEVWAGGGQYLGIFPLSALPLTITNYPEGAANNFLKVCINDQPNCCKIVQFSGPNCGSGPCEITNFHVVTGVCTGDSTYKLTLNFDVSNPLTNMFSVTANGQFFGFYNLSQLPLTINFPWNGGTNDVIEVCVVTAPGIACCKKLEFKVPDCILHPVCEIYDLSVTVGDCTSDSTYKVKVDFQVNGNTTQEFMLWANGQSLGTFNLSQLPLTITNFPWDGGAFDVVKVCMKSSDPSAAPCCRSKEFAVPACLQQCEIKELTVTTGDCTSDSTYKVKINFVVNGSSSNTFGVWANGVNIGFFNLNQLPLTIQNFPSNGGANDVIKICMMGNNTGQVLCCITKEFPVPPCIDLNCKIWDLKVIKTPCLCGKFFAVLTFNHQNGGSGGFDIVGNGQNYGNYPYNHPQPIIIGPLMGDGITMYEFAVKDHLHPDCHDAVNLGKVECSTPTDELAGGSGHLALSPNPASERLNVSAQMDGISSIGQVQVEVRHADGRLMMTTSVPDGNNFQLDVSTLASGVYRLTLLADRGRLEGSFVKSE